MKKQNGFTLVELLISSLIGLVVIGGFLSVFLSNTQIFRVQNVIEDIQGDARFTLDTILNLSQNTGYLGCFGNGSRASIENLLATPSNDLWDLTTTVQGFNNIDADEGIGGIADFIAGTDVLVLKRMQGSVLLNGASTSTALSVDNPGHPFAAGQILIVADCDQATIFQATSLNNATSGTTFLNHISNTTYTPSNTTATMNNLYNKGAEIGVLETKIYYLKLGVNGRSALFEASLVINNDTTVAISENEMIANVEDFQIVFGEDTNNDQSVDLHRNANNIANWDSVISVQIALLLSSEASHVTSTLNSYSFDATNFTFTKDSTPKSSADYRLRHVVTGIGSFRNRTF